MEAKYKRVVDQVIDFDFRKTFWGMTRSDVKISENTYPLSENETHITYDDTFMSLRATVGFHFMDDLLIEAGYAFREFYTDRALYISAYERVKLMITQIYGAPAIQRDYGSTCEKNCCCIETCTDQSAEMCIVEWLTERSIIRLLFVSDESSTEFGILHLSRKQDNIFKSSLS